MATLGNMVVKFLKLFHESSSGKQTERVRESVSVCVWERERERERERQRQRFGNIPLDTKETRVSFAK